MYEYFDNNINNVCEKLRNLYNIIKDNNIDKKDILE